MCRYRRPARLFPCPEIATVPGRRPGAVNLRRKGSGEAAGQASAYPARTLPASGTTFERTGVRRNGFYGLVLQEADPDDPRRPESELKSQTRHPAELRACERA